MRRSRSGWSSGTVCASSLHSWSLVLGGSRTSCATRRRRSRRRRDRHRMKRRVGFVVVEVVARQTGERPRTECFRRSRTPRRPTTVLMSAATDELAPCRPTCRSSRARTIRPRTAGVMTSANRLDEMQLRLVGTRLAGKYEWSRSPSWTSGRTSSRGRIPPEIHEAEGDPQPRLLARRHLGPKSRGIRADVERGDGRAVMRMTKAPTLATVTWRGLKRFQHVGRDEDHQEEEVAQFRKTQSPKMGRLSIGRTLSIISPVPHGNAEVIDEMSHHGPDAAGDVRSTARRRRWAPSRDRQHPAELHQRAAHAEPHARRTPPPRRALPSSGEWAALLGSDRGAGMYATAA